MSPSETDGWMATLAEMLVDRFGDRVVFVGLQGSRARGEAGEDSDIDAVVILDSVGYGDILEYRRILDSMPHREKACGFLSGKGDLAGWDPADLYQFRHDILTVSGDLGSILPPEDPDDSRLAARMGVCSVYHMCVHNMLHEMSVGVLDAALKTARFAIQAEVHRRTGTYHRGLSDLVGAASDEEAGILRMREEAAGMGSWCPRAEGMSYALVAWASAQISRSGQV